MNLHLPRSATSKYETKDILNVKKQFINPQSNKPCMGSIMDASLGLKMFCEDNIWLDKNEVVNLMCHIPNFTGMLPSPSDKTNVLWSGKQVFSMILPKLNYYERGDNGEIKTLIQKGKFLKGSISKRMIGTGSRGLIQIIYNDFGPNETRDFLSNIQILMCHWLKTVGFSVGIKDVVPDIITERKIHNIIHETKDLVIKKINDTENTFHLDSPDIVQSDFEGDVISKVNITRDTAGGMASKNLTNSNSIKMMVSISKGSFINISQIMATVGQQSVSYNKTTGRVPDSFEGRPLPHYTKFDYTPDCRGYVENSYYKGLSASEFFYHAMSGREGLIDTAVKSVTGDTSLIISDNHILKRIEIGAWIDQNLENNKDKIIYYDEKDANMELLDIDNMNVYIPTTTNQGNMSWEKVTKITRHDPSEFIYHIKTKYGREVKVVKSKSLLIWNGNEYEPKDMTEVNIGDKVPVCMKLDIPDNFNFTDKQHKDMEMLQSNTYSIVYDINDNYKQIDNSELIIQNDTILDEIISIKKLSSEKYPKVYDITVPSTKNFGLANGLQVYDTSETGYIQRQLVKMLEDMIVQYDHTTRNESNNVVQHLYGGDGMDPCSIEMQPIPKYLKNMEIFNKTFKYLEDNKLKNRKEFSKLCELKKIYEDQYHYLENIFLPINIPRMIKNYTSRYKNSVKKCDMNYNQVYNIINDFCEELDIYPNRNNKILTDINHHATMMLRIMLHMEFSYNKVQKEGICEALLFKMLDKIKETFYNSIMQPGSAAGILTAQSLGEPCTQLSIVYDTKVIVKKNNRTHSIKIGRFIDNIMEKHKKNRITTHITESGESHILNIPKKWNYYVPSLSKKEKVEWSRLTQISRHPPNGQLVRIKTRTGREITSTLAHSFVTRKNNQIVQIRGDELKEGDFLPIIQNLESNDELKEIDGFELTESFGNFIGQLLSDCHVSKNGYTVEVCNTEYSFIEKTKEFCKELNYNTREKSENPIRGFKSNKTVHTLVINSKILNSLCKKWCNINGKIDYFHKKIPDWSINAPKQFLKGLLSSYFDGDGNVCYNKNRPANRCVRAHSSSKELLKGISILLTRFGIYSTINISRNKDKKILYEINIMTKYIKSFHEKIGFGIPYKQETLKELLKFENKPNYNGLDRIPGIGNALTEIGRELQMLHYVNRFSKKGNIGRDTLIKYINKFEEKNCSKVFDEIKLLKQGCYSDVFWDTIESVEYIDTKAEYVYDFSVDENETFSTLDGLIVHNTLNTFHSAGIASKTQITSGVPRIRELITLSKKPKTPSMTIFFDDKTQDEIEILKNKLVYTSLSDLLVQSKIFFDPDIMNSNIEEDADWLNYDYRLYNDDYEDTNYSMYVIRIEISSYELFERSLTVEYIYNQIMEVHTKKNLQIMFKEENADHIYMYIRTTKPNTTLKEIKTLETTLLSTKICGIENITRTFIRKETKEEFQDGTLVEKEYYVVDTEGTNLHEVLGLPYVNTQKTYSNDVNEMINVFGILAGARALEIEIDKVMKSSGIFINKKHIELLARSMTSKGIVLPVNRHGSKKSNRGPLSRSSFEETNDQLTKASVHSEEDFLTGVSSNIIMAQIAPIGTGKCELVVDMDKIENL